MPYKPVITIDIADWDAEALATETPITSKADMLAQLKAGTPTGTVARTYVAWRNRGQSPKDLLKPDKLLLYTGAREGVAKIAQQERHSVETPKGTTYNARSFIGAIGRPVEDPETGEVTFQTTIDGEGEADEQPVAFVMHDSPAALERTRSYLLNVIPGHIWTRLLLLHEQGGDVAGVVAELKAKIDEMVRRLEPGD